MKKDSKTRILVCCHKPSITPDCDGYYPIQVGKARTDVDLDMHGDDTGDNISDKNDRYCELTGLYWAWKNLRDADIIGLCHYRRYFDFHGQCRRPFQGVYYPSNQFDRIDFSIPDRILAAVREGSVVLAKPFFYHVSLYDGYGLCHFSDDMRTLEDVFKETQTDSFNKAFKKVMRRHDRLCPYNMFLMNRETLDKYCTWLFGLLEEVEHRILIDQYTPYQRRIFGFLAERLLNVYVEAEKLNVIHKPVIVVDDQYKDKTYIESDSAYRLPFYLSRIIGRYIELKKRVFHTH